MKPCCRPVSYLVTALLVLALGGIGACTKPTSSTEKQATIRTPPPAGPGKGATPQAATKPPTPAATPGPAAAGKTTPLEPLGLQAELSPTAKVGKAIVGTGVMITGGEVGAMTITEAGTASPATIDAAKQELEMYNPKNLKVEKLEDGWALTFENKGGLGTNYWVKARRTIGGKDYTCESTVSKPSQQAAVLGACKSLKK